MLTVQYCFKYKVDNCADSTEAFPSIIEKLKMKTRMKAKNFWARPWG